jgi:hypothetical protein
MYRTILAAASMVLVAATAPATQAQSIEGTVTATHAGVNCFAFSVNNTEFYAIDLNVPGGEHEANDIRASRDTGKKLSFDVSSTQISCNSNLYSEGLLFAAVNINIVN